MKYLEALFQETLRVSAPRNRSFYDVATADFTINNNDKKKELSVKKGTLVAISTFTNNFSAKYHKEPFDFTLERYLDKNSLSNKSLKGELSHISLFNQGDVGSIDKRFAFLVGKVVLGILLRHYDCQPSPKYKLRLRLKMYYEPEMDFICYLFSRNDNIKEEEEKEIETSSN